MVDLVRTELGSDLYGIARKFVSVLTMITAFFFDERSSCRKLLCLVAPPDRAEELLD